MIFLRFDLIALGLTIAAGVIATSVQTVRLSNAKEQVATLRLEIADINARAAQQALELQAAVTKAQNEAKNREATLRIAAAGAKSELDGLRGELEQTREQLSQLSRDAAIERAAAIGAVLGQCAERHQTLAQRCDRHVNDIRTLIDAWPKQ